MQYTEPSGLPEADAASEAHSRKVRDFIAGRIRGAGGSVGFAEFMQHALYAPGLGYYSAGAVKFGAQGDFVTAPEISPVFGRVVARQVAAVLGQLDGGDVLEFGAGSGQLAVDMLLMLEQLDALPARYRILEVSADLQERQAQRLREQAAALADRVEWLSALPRSFDGVVIANEVLDAMPAERFRRTATGVEQQRVELDGDGFRFLFGPAPDLLAKAVSAIEADLGRTLDEGYVSEVSLGVAPWIADLGAMLGRGCVFLFDYGTRRADYYAADRSGGWLTCHFRHRAHDNPLVLAGIQDITAWVDFTAVASAAVDAGFEIAGYAPQSTFLANGGLLEEMQTFGELDVQQQIALSAQIKTLTLPGEMGENVKCMALRRGPIDTPGAFLTGDRTHTL